MSVKKIQLKPKSAHFFWWILTGVLLIPMFGLGIYIIYRQLQKQSSISYIITDDTIIAIANGYTKSIDLFQLSDIQVSQRWIDKRFNTGTIHLQSEAVSIEMIGIENPEKISEIISMAAESARLRLEKRSNQKNEMIDTHPGSLDKLDYLTGLWQQGLLSDQDYKEEKKHFES
ncbi:MAG: PH domain-containing protein [Balneolaceae bacterium]